jgi:hypothetical protein
MDYEIGWAPRFGLDALEKGNFSESTRGTKLQLCALFTFMVPCIIIHKIE